MNLKDKNSKYLRYSLKKMQEEIKEDELKGLGSKKELSQNDIKKMLELRKKLQI